MLTLCIVAFVIALFLGSGWLTLSIIAFVALLFWWADWYDDQIVHMQNIRDGY